MEQNMVLGVKLLIGVKFSLFGTTIEDIEARGEIQ